jgi:hypothetical protein
VFKLLGVFKCWRSMHCLFSPAVATLGCCGSVEVCLLVDMWSCFDAVCMPIVCLLCNQCTLSDKQF